MIHHLFLFFYYILAYSLGIAVLVSVAVSLKTWKDSPVSGFFISTLSMTCTVLVSTLQNYLQLPVSSIGSDVLVGINYLTAVFFTVFIILFFHAVYPWSRCRLMNKMIAVIMSVLGLMTLVNLLWPFWDPMPDLLLGMKNAAILYTAILGIRYRRQPDRTRSRRFTRIIGLVIIVCMPFLFLTELAAFKSLMLRILPGMSLRGPWVLPGIYIMWCVAWLVAGSREGKGLTPSESFCSAYGITAREREVMNLLIQGRSYRAIMQDLFISLPTVKTHISSLYRKTGTVNRLELAVKAGLFPLASPNHTND